MKDNWIPFINRVIERYEGGYGWDRGDSGGPTKFGITCYDLAEERHERMDSMARWAPIVRAMPLSEADTIYASKYAIQCDFDNLNSGCDGVVCDFGINSGSSRAIKFAQSIVGVPADGALGPVTQEAINKMDATKFINALCVARMSFLRKLNIFSTFGKGWTSRVSDLRNYCLELAKEHPAEEPKETFQKKVIRIPMSHIKAYHKEDLQSLHQVHSAS